MSNSTRTLRSHFRSQPSPGDSATKSASQKKKKRGIKESKSASSPQIEEESDEVFFTEPEDQDTDKMAATQIEHGNGNQRKMQS